MKKLLAIVLVFASHAMQAQKWGMEYGFNYVYANPTGGMGRVIEQGHGIGLNFGLVKPNQRFAFGVDLNFEQYGQDESRQQYTFDDGTTVPMDVYVTNSYVNVLGYTRLNLTTKGIVRPYLVGKLGYSNFKTDLNIYDPNEEDSCEPVDKDVLSRDGTMIVAFGAGAKFDVASIFKKLPSGMLFFESSVNYSQGGQVQYMNVNADPSSTHQHAASPDSDPVMIQFINTQTQIIHEHHVGNLYSNPVQMVELRFGMSMYFSRMGFSAKE